MRRHLIGPHFYEFLTFQWRAANKLLMVGFPPPLISKNDYSALTAVKKKETEFSTSLNLTRDERNGKRCFVKPPFSVTLPSRVISRQNQGSDFTPSRTLNRNKSNWGFSLGIHWDQQAFDVSYSTIKFWMDSHREKKITVIQNNGRENWPFKIFFFFSRSFWEFFFISFFQYFSVTLFPIIKMWHFSIIILTGVVSFLR